CEHRAGTRVDDHTATLKPLSACSAAVWIRESMVSLAVLPGLVWPASDAMGCLRVLLIRKDFKQKNIDILQSIGLRVLLIRKDFKRKDVV
ncbi:hypothetical protein, partial [Blautia sp.]|uniref:hypothetical protein n=1 Tax=Blautia sp. TaxID=1955243 RepID=UPI003AB7A237